MRDTVHADPLEVVGIGGWTRVSGTEGSMRVGAGRKAGTRAVQVTVTAASAVLALTACTSSHGSHNPASTSAPSATASATPTQSTTPSASSSKPASAAVVTFEPQAGAAHVNPTQPVVVKVSNGTLTSVRMLNPAGVAVTGELGQDGTSWHTTEDLGYSRTYQITATARDGEGATSVKRESITTLTPANMTLPYFQTVYGNTLAKGTYGVGMVAVVRFDEAIPDKKAAEQAMTVTTTPHVDGAWYWLDNSTAHWRPEHYYAPGTKVSITAKVYGKDLGNGLYGQSDESASFTIGARHYSVANAATHYVTVYDGSAKVRSMPTSMGRGGWVQGKNGKISLWTMPGVYTVINHENPATMSSDSYGLPANSPYGYAPEKVPWATKISTDGIYLHELDATVWAQGHQNLSHGCLNLNYDNAKWFYNFSRVGDVVKVINSGGPAIQVWQGGDWSVPWSTWVKGGNS